jgi:anthraniloyl-CoA monooxygenase
MKVSILGAGPAGLYLGILLAKADPRHEIEIVERNAPDATFGWGVVFSEEALGALRDADYRTYIEITDTFARWDTIDIRYRGRRLRSRGHAFSAIGRRLLLEILQRRCRELDVQLRYGVEIDEPATFGREADLIVGADGVNSVVRRAHRDAFGTSLAPEGCRFAWFGTNLVLDAFTFAFRATEHGLFQAHAYPFDEHTSTFIVECPEPVWQRAGLDEMSEEESIAFCEDVFAEELSGHRLLSNRSIWMTFVKVRNESWHHGNVVLLGDAAHTAHFTIGSGTKLAMDDAIALANAFVRHRDLEAALVDYELERQPVVERFQEAASESAAYFERVSRTTQLEPIQFAFNLLTRSGRISHTNLALRDPGFVRVLDAWFAGAASAGRDDGATAAIAPPPMFAQLRLGGVTLPNRVVRALRWTVADAAAGGTGLVPSAPDGTVPAAAASGAGLVLSGLVAVSLDGRVTPETPVLEEDESWAGAVDRVHAGGALAALQLGHAGRRGATRPHAEGIDLPLRAGAWPLLSASAIPYGPLGAVPKEMDEDDMARVRDDFAAAAARAATAGFDVLELNFGHGYLVASFLSPLSNRRGDRYGGSLEGRLRFPLEVLEAARGAWPEDRLLAVRLSVSDWARRGLTVDEGIEVAQAMAERGAQLVHTVAGQTVIGGEPRYRRGYLTALSTRVRTEARVPTLVGGWLTTPDEVNTIVAAGRADLCILELEETGLESEVTAEAAAAADVVTA